MKTNNIFILLASLVLLTFNFILIRLDIYSGLNNSVGLNKIQAKYDGDEKDEEDEEDEDGDDRDDNDYQEEIIYEWVEIPATSTTLAPAVSNQTVIRYITVVDPGFDIDTDNDDLVDAIDPHPTIDERELFNDDDNDGIPNATDKFKGDNDFLYIDFSDSNANGILDSFEY